MSYALWERLPTGVLKKSYDAFARLDYEVRLLIVKLAEKQKYKCAFCSSPRNLIIEHDHEPEQGDGDRYTIHNIRGLVCHRCNWHLGMYEKEERGEYTGWENLNLTISSSEYEIYIDDYECRLRAMHEELVAQTCSNYWARRLLLDRFDEWKYDDCGEYPWYWGFEEIKEKRHGAIRTPMRFLKYLEAVLNFIKEESKKDPNYVPPDAFFEMMVKIKPFFDKIRPIVEARLKEIAARTGRVHPLIAGQVTNPPSTA